MLLQQKKKGIETHFNVSSSLLFSPTLPSHSFTQLKTKNISSSSSNNNTQQQEQQQPQPQTEKKKKKKKKMKKIYMAKQQQIINNLFSGNDGDGE